MDPHWCPPKGRVASILFKVLCIASFGVPTLQHMWDATETNRAWKEERGALVARFNNMTVVGGLLLATVVVMVTTQPPVPKLSNWTIGFPYLCLLLSAGLILGAIVVSATIGLAFSSSQRLYIRKVCKSRPRIVFLLLALAYPFFMLGVATLIFSVGFVAAAWLVGYKILMVCTTIGLLLPTLVASIVIWVLNV